MVMVFEKDPFISAIWPPWNSSEHQLLCLFCLSPGRADQENGMQDKATRWSGARRIRLLKEVSGSWNCIPGNRPLDQAVGDVVPFLTISGGKRKQATCGYFRRPLCEDNDIMNQNSSVTLKKRREVITHPIPTW